MRHDRRFLPEDGVASGVVAVPVGVDEELQLAVMDLCGRGADLVGQRRELIVDHQDAVVADEQADVAAGTFEHVDIARDVSTLDLDFGKVALGDGVTDQQEQGGRGDEMGRVMGKV